MPEHSAESTAPDETLDTLREGRLKIIQKKHGYRFSVDALLLARFAGEGRTGRVADLGTGSAVIPLLLAAEKAARRIVGFEVQEELADMARRNVALNGFEDRIEIVHGDIKDLASPPLRESFDLVLSNPPYVPAGQGRLSDNPEKAVARHEVACSLEDVLRAAFHLVRTGGRVALVYPAERLPDLLVALRARGLEPKRLRMVHPRLGDPARLTLLEATKGGRPRLEILPPLVLFR